MKALVRFDYGRNILYATLTGPLSPREQSEFFIKAASLLFGRSKRQSLVVFQDGNSALCDTRQLLALFRGLGKLTVQRIALVGVPEEKRSTLHGILESAQYSARRFNHEFFDSPDEAFSWFKSENKHQKLAESETRISRVEIEDLLNITFCGNRGETTHLKDETKSLDKRLDCTKKTHQ